MDESAQGRTETSQTTPYVGHITPLPLDLIERVAAGEVIERPASVVRELVDNALDAGAKTVRIELRDGGLRLMRVIDDGRGIHGDELELACQRHTTSKVHTLQDLQTVTTLGFRGEALASITAVAEVDIVSACDGGGLGNGMTIALGHAPRHYQTSRSRGTTVTVQYLFQTMPARRSLLHGPTTEAAQCLVVARGFALAYPGVQFSLIVDGQLLFRTPGTTLDDAVAALYGTDVARELIPLHQTEAQTAIISGALSARGFTQPTRDHIYVTVNHRLVSNRALVSAVEAGYRPHLRKGRHPLVIVNIAIASERVDANIHPAKARVLLQDEKAIAQAVRGAVHAALGATPASVPLHSTVPTGTYFVRPLQLHLTTPRTRRGLRIRDRPGTYRLQPARHTDNRSSTIGTLTALCQFEHTLIVAHEASGDLYLVDQHRAHERILYERLKHETRSFPSPPHIDYGYKKDDAIPSAPNALASQSLLEPMLIELSRRQSEILSSRLDELATLGLDCQPFGGSVFLIRAVPLLAGSAVQPAAFAQALTQDAAEDTNDWLDQVCISLACRSAIRRGQTLAVPEQQALLDDLAAVTSKASCPHGSPLLVRYGHEFLTHLFEW